MNAGERRSLRFGILCDGTHLERWQLSCLSKLATVPGVSAQLLLVASGNVPASAWLFKRIGGSPGAESQQHRIELSEELTQLPVLRLAADQDRTAEELRSYSLDFILCFLNAPVAHQLVELTPYGVWAYHFGNWQNDGSAPPGFWEVHGGASISGGMLVSLTQDPDTAICLRQGYLRTKRLSFVRNREHLLSRFSHWPAQVCVDVQEGNADYFSSSPLRRKSPGRSRPRSIDVLAFGLRVLRYAASAGWRELLLRDRWNVGIVRQPIADFLNSALPKPQVEWLPRQSANEFLADPFGVMKDGRLTIICEHLDYRDGLGNIAAIAADEGSKVIPVQIGPQPRVHLSYPYLVEHDGRLFCIPETHQAKEVALYVSERFPQQWSRVSTLLAHVELVDTTLFHFQGHWWLAAADAGLSSPSADLFLWYAIGIAGPWTAHPRNPVKTDVRSARPAGTPFIVDGTLYRPAMDCSEAYGGRLVINRVLELTPVAFREEVVACVEPDANGPYPDGLHTLAAVGDVTLIDGNRRTFVSTEILGELGQLARRVLGRRAGRADAE